jgi:MFS family permease
MKSRQRSAIRRLAAARVLSGIGGAAAFVVLPLDIYARTGSALWLSATFFITVVLRGVFSLVAGPMVDRLDRRRLMIATDLLSVGCWLTMAFLDSAAGLLVVGFIAQVLVIPHWLASDAAVPNLVHPDALTRANATISMAGNVSMLLGPAVGGVIVALSGPPAVYGLDAASFLVSAAILVTVPGSFGPEASERDREEDAGAERRPWTTFLRHDPALVRLLCAWAVLGAAFDLTLVADLPLVRIFGAGPVGYGVMQSAAGVGAVLGAAWARGMSRRAEIRSVVFAPVAVAASSLMIALAPWFWVVVAGMLIGSLAADPQEVGSDSLTQRLAPDEIRGKIFAAMSAAYFLGSAFGLAIAGFLLTPLGPRVLYAIGALGVLSVVPILLPLRVLPEDGRASRP